MQYSAMTIRLTTLAALCVFCGNLRAQDAPDPVRVIEAARMAATLQHNDLTGKLTKDGKKTDVALFLKGKDIQFQFSQSGGPWSVFHMRLADASYDLFEMVDGKTKRFPTEKLGQSIGGTDMSYEDLSFRFFYWPDPRYERLEAVKGRDCFKIRLNRPSGSGGRYEVVYVWVDVKSGAFMKIRGHDKKGVLLKEFSVEDVMQLSDGSWTLRKMQVSSYDSGGRRSGITDLLFEAPKKAGPRGLH
jgi:hypothetical protein